MNPAIDQLLKDREEQERAAAAALPKIAETSKSDTEDKEAAERREAIRRFHAERAQIIRAYIKALLAVELNSSLSAADFFSGVLFYAQQDNLLAVTLQRGEKTVGVPDATDTALPFHLLPPEEEPIQPTTHE